LPPRNRIVAALLAQLLPALEQFDRDGLAPFLPRHATFDALAGRGIVVHGGDGEHSGTALGLAADGALRVQLAQGERSFHAGEVSVRRR
jgi:BirA family biotin operon repressor/biotin-[acetyl-CoA-carboxylase] ligase